MVFHNQTPYWALLANSGVEPGQETVECSDWNNASQLSWIGLGGVPSTSCSWEGGTTSNYRGLDGIEFTAYGTPNSEEDMIEGSDSGSSISVAQGVTISNLKVYVSVENKHSESSGDWYFNIVVDGTPATENCILSDVTKDPRTNSGKVMHCDISLSLYVAADSTISVSSYWNATRSAKDFVNDDIDWVISYSLGASLD